MMRLILWIPLLLLFLSGCIVVRSDAARVDPESGSFVIDLTSGGEQDRDSDENEGQDDDDDDDDDDD
ncbi:MAG TPA: hypothetical protein EYF93_09515, partial [Planctomycetes bacterium]|nr:hypothetical protein [Planctomycetota bacterium]